MLNASEYNMLKAAGLITLTKLENGDVEVTAQRYAPDGTTETNKHVINPDNLRGQRPNLVNALNHHKEQYALVKTDLEGLDAMIADIEAKAEEGLPDSI